VALATLLEIPGLGPGKARSVYRELGVSTLPELEDAARSGRLRDVSGFGPKAVDVLLANLERMKQRTSRSLLSDAWVAYTQVRDAIAGPGAAEVAQLAVVGSTGRMQDSDD